MSLIYQCFIGVYVCFLFANLCFFYDYIIFLDYLFHFYCFLRPLVVGLT